MDFRSIRMITENVDRLVLFYEHVTGLVAVRHTEDFAELKTPTCTLAIASVRTTRLLAAGSVLPAHNQSVFLEFLVDDVDQEYARLEPSIQEVVLKPTTMPWGNRSMLFRDPDGNVINFFRPVSATGL